MDKIEKVRTLFNLFELINFYYENRDQPAEIDYFQELENYCVLLDVDFTEFKKKFSITKSHDSF